MMNYKKEVDTKDRSLKIIQQLNKKSIITVILTIFFILAFFIYIFYYFFYSSLIRAKNNDEPIYFSILFLDDNKSPYCAYFGIVSSLHNRIGMIGLSRSISLWLNSGDSSIPIYSLYKNGGDNAVFNAIERASNKKISYRITIDNNQISDIIDLIGGVKMYIESPIEFEDNDMGYNLSFNVGEWLFTGDKVVSYLHYLNMKGYEDIERLYRLEDVIINVIIGFIEYPELRAIVNNRDIRMKIASLIKSNLRPPDIKVFFDILANSSFGTLIIENIDARIDNNGNLTPIFDGRAFIKQINDLTSYTELKTQKSKLNNEDVSLSVLNATGISGLADRINIRMRYRGFSAMEYGNFYTNLNDSVVLIRDGQVEKAFMVANECRISRVYAKTDRRVLNNVVLILGNDYYEITR